MKFDISRFVNKALVDVEIDEMKLAVEYLEKEAVGKNIAIDFIEIDTTTKRINFKVTFPSGSILEAEQGSLNGLINQIQRGSHPDDRRQKAQEEFKNSVKSKLRTAFNDIIVTPDDYVERVGKRSIKTSSAKFAPLFRAVDSKWSFKTKRWNLKDEALTDIVENEIKSLFSQNEDKYDSLVSEYNAIKEKGYQPLRIDYNEYIAKLDKYISEVIGQDRSIFDFTTHTEYTQFARDQFHPAARSAVLESIDDSIDASKFVDVDSKLYRSDILICDDELYSEARKIYVNAFIDAFINSEYGIQIEEEAKKCLIQEAELAKQAKKQDELLQMDDEYYSSWEEKSLTAATCRLRHENYTGQKGAVYIVLPKTKREVDIKCWVGSEKSSNRKDINYYEVPIVPGAYYRFKTGWFGKVYGYTTEELIKMLKKA